MDIFEDSTPTEKSLSDISLYTELTKQNTADTVGHLYRIESELQEIKRLLYSAVWILQVAFGLGVGYIVIYVYHKIFN